MISNLNKSNNLENMINLNDSKNSKSDSDIQIIKDTQLTLDSNLEDFLDCDVKDLDIFLENNKMTLKKKYIRKNNEEFMFISNNNTDNNDKILNFFRSLIYVKKNDRYILLNYTYSNIKIYSEKDYTNNIIKLNKDDELYEGFEGTTISCFNYNDIWYYTTTKCIDMFESYFHDKMSYGNMFMEILGCENLNNFEDMMDKNNNYYFIIIHHKNKNLVDYTLKFGKNYKKIIYIGSKNKLSMIENENDNFSNKFMDKGYINLIDYKTTKINKNQLNQLDFRYNNYNGLL
jgi:hypothetical protein